ncbi:MAG: alginate O-acetyltransferase complex protein AlgJ [Acidobacteriota bacterium]|nr:alginate O-acetyltransferase complex protein AlgJ [Acidobacteriota bacterium]
MPNRTIRSVEEIALIAFFIAAITLPLAVLLIHGEGAPAWENRRLTPLPSRPSGLSDAYNLPRMLTEYFKDHFGLRAELIRRQAAFKVDWLASSSSPDVMLGKDGWLFHSGAKEVELFSGSEPFTEAKLANWRQSLEGIRDRLKANGAQFILTFAPEKQTIYPEHLPDGLIRVREESRQDQLIRYLKEQHSDIHIVDLRPALREAKTANQVYFRTDTHWNDLGAFAAYRALAAELGRDFKAIHPLSASDVEFYDVPRSGDLAGMLGLRGVLTEAGVNLRLKQPHARFEGNCFDPGQCVSEKDDAALPRLVMYRDSFSSYMLACVAEHFSRAVYVWDIEWKLSPALIEAERPDVVVLEMVERNLMLPPPAPPSDTHAH